MIISVINHTNGKTLQSFGVNPGGYIGYFNPATGESEAFSLRGDKKAAQRLAIKQKAKDARRPQGD
jgi:hypothetical protein